MIEDTLNEAIHNNIKAIRELRKEITEGGYDELCLDLMASHCEQIGSLVMQAADMGLVLNFSK